MSKESAAAFIQAVMADEEMLKRANDNSPEEAVSLAKGMGYDFTLEEFKDVMNADKELSADELESVAGGVRLIPESDGQRLLRTHCKGDPNGPFHNYVYDGHKEYSLCGLSLHEYENYKCTLCGYVDSRPV